MHPEGNQMFSIRPLLASVLVFASIVPVTARAENLNEKFGPSWDCSYITFGQPLYNACKPCEDKGMDFWRDSETTGHCVPKPGQPPPKSPPAVQPTKKPTQNPKFYIFRICNQA